MSKKKLTLIYIISLLLLFLCILLSLTYGSNSVTFQQMLKAIFIKSDVSIESIIVRERIPRTIFSIIAGASLALSGTLMQSITRNPIADPSILGVNMGASLCVVFGITYLGINTYFQYVALGLFGASITSIVVYYIASLGIGGTTPIKLALAGSATSAILSSAISTIILPRQDIMSEFRFWQVGSLGGANYEIIITILPFVIAGILIGLFFAPALNALSLGDEVARGLGVNVPFVRGICAFAGVLLCGSITAVAGPIAFVGLMVPHTIRLIIGSNIKAIIPLSLIFGGIILTISDVVGRVVGSPGEIEVGIITAIIGAPILIIVARKAKVKQL